MKNEQKTFSLSHYFSQLKQRMNGKDVKLDELNLYHCLKCGELIEGLNTTMKHYCVGKKLNIKGEKEMNDETIEKRNLGDGRYGLEDDKVATKLLDKSYSPMIIRKYTRIGFPLYIHMICDANLDNLDTLVHDCIDYCREHNILSNSIQSLRNFTGVLSEWLNNHYDGVKRGCVESLGVIFYCDKMIISSLQGDCMNHESCRQEMYDCLNLMTKI